MEFWKVCRNQALDKRGEKMLELNNRGIEKKEEWEKQGFNLPKFNRE